MLLYVHAISVRGRVFAHAGWGGRWRCTFGIVVALGLCRGASAAPLGTAFTYQCQVRVNGMPANGPCDFQFQLFDAVAGGNAVGGMLSQFSVNVSGGLFSSRLDFGAAPFGNLELWLQMNVRTPAGQGNYVALPRQLLSPAPFAVYATRAGMLALPWIASAGVASPNALVALTNTGTGDGMKSTTTTGWAGYFDGGAGDKALYAEGNVGINTLTPTEALEVVGSVRVISAFKVSDGLFNASQGGALELGRQSGGTATPFIDFHHGDASDFNVRLINQVSGQLSCSGIFNAPIKNFIIDHPLDPANKTLVHTCVESNEMAVVYSGNATTDARGDAVVALPDYVESLARDFRYQLTPIGQFAQAMVATELKSGRFVIRTDKPGVKVSWQVTGIRQDAFARAHPVEAEQPKSPGDRGRYWNPTEHGQPASAQIGPTDQLDD